MRCSRHKAKRHLPLSWPVRPPAGSSPDPQPQNPAHPVIRATPQIVRLPHRQEGPDDMPAYVTAALLLTSLQIPVIGGRLALACRQGVFRVGDQPYHRSIVMIQR